MGGDPLVRPAGTAEPVPTRVEEAEGPVGGRGGGSRGGCEAGRLAGGCGRWGGCAAGKAPASFGGIGTLAPDGFGAPRKRGGGSGGGAPSTRVRVGGPPEAAAI